MSGFSHYRNPIDYPAENSFVSPSNHKSSPTPPSYSDLPPHEKNLHFNSNSNQNNFPTSVNTPPDQDTSHPSHYPNTLQPLQAELYSPHTDHSPNIPRHYMTPAQHNMGSSAPHNYHNVVVTQGPVQLLKPRDPILIDRAVSLRPSPSPSQKMPPPAEPNKGTLLDLEGCICFQYDVLKKVTCDFNQAKYSAGGNLLGEGGFGPVYLGHLCSTAVAIKVLQNASTGRNVYKGDEQFKTEIKVLTRYRHENLLTLMGYSEDGPSRCIVYEYMCNGTLEDWLEGKKDPLHWTYRHKILLDTARGLLYLHQADPKHPLIHRDVKTANVLLDSSMQAKVGDFGLARQTNIDIANKTGTILGTSGYIPPEYYSGEISTKTDVYAFGVVVLEVLTGLPSFDGRCDCKELVFRMRRSVSVNHREMLRWVDKNSGDWPSSAYFEISRIAWDSLEKLPNFRPDMDKTLEALQTIHSQHSSNKVRTPIYSH